MEITLVQAEVVISKSNVAHNRNQFIQYLHHTQYVQYEVCCMLEHWLTQVKV